MGSAFRYDRGEILRADIDETDCEGGGRSNRVRDRIQWRVLVLAALNVRVLAHSYCSLTQGIDAILTRRLKWIYV
jgi:hypothetical protein